MNETRVIEVLNKIIEETEEAMDCSLTNGRDRMDWREEVEAIETILDLYNKEKEKNIELEKDISKMYYEEAIINILEDKLNIGRNEAIELLEE